MNLKSRREFLKLTTQTSISMAGLSLLPNSILNALASPVPKRTGTIQDVEHIVIFMQENRSFDHYFGTLRGVRGFGDPRAISLSSGRSVWNQPNTDHQSHILPFAFNSKETSSQWIENLDHSWKESQKIWAQHDCWIEKKSPLTMGYFSRSDIPFYYALADAFTIGDAYYSSIFGPTDPNRLFLFTGTSGLTVNAVGDHVVHNRDDGNETANMELDKVPYDSYTWTTYAERLQAAGISWKVYQEYDNYGDNALAYFKNFRNLDKNSELYHRARAWVRGSNSENASISNAQYLVDAFGADIANGTLPQVSWIVAPTKFCEHPIWPPGYGESLTSRLLETLASHKETWERTAFIINYDENDGFFDHMPPYTLPVSPNLGKSTISKKGEIYNDEPLGLGIRVPLLVISPWTKGGWVCSEVFDHTSIIRFLEKRFKVFEPNISPWRRAICGDLTSMFNFKTPDVTWPKNIPNTNNVIEKTDAMKQLQVPIIPEKQQLPKQEKGVRPARALPYNLLVNTKIDFKKKNVNIIFSNIGKNTAGFFVYNMLKKSSPKNYTLGAANTIIDSWNENDCSNGIYDLNIHGPNGFFRKFKGSLNLQNDKEFPIPEVYLNYMNNELFFIFKNLGNKTCTFYITDNSYGNKGITIKVPPKSSIKKNIDLTLSYNWYDITITINHENYFYRQFAGHLEDGLPSISDPAIS
ncbi:phospholipase C, phosphocholine-specific [Pigmentibacter sp. JX0631]|uniref:phosphocholine-specific phospholipase C n=1 Tax=Pigmentibacter sp. JX0631 TaxID=2976982 RepID=UPI0024697D92|nr:phospholipase C, phosphocholine-specific [Pigmentibacter sp. JX0631]WGL60482.1 phospholipase C, phosphocholine-specific [Pigmentibacter sp. JX0631]